MQIHHGHPVTIAAESLQLSPAILSQQNSDMHTEAGITAFRFVLLERSEARSRFWLYGVPD